MNILVAYYSLTGNTAKVAQAIYDEVLSQVHNGELKELKAINAQNLDNYDVVFFGSACHDSGLAKPVNQLLETIPESACLKMAGFVTHATQMPEQGERQRELYDRWAGYCLPTFADTCKNKHIPFLGYFHCQGKPSPGIAEFIHNVIVTEDEEWESYIAEVMEHPDDKDIEDAKAFARHVLAEY